MEQAKFYKINKGDAFYFYVYDEFVFLRVRYVPRPCFSDTFISFNIVYTSHGSAFRVGDIISRSYENIGFLDSAKDEKLFSLLFGDS